ncbi:hypothetical protein GTY87_39950 [Streptomyces sp. SID7813]|uniref:Uncharacterized protein n=1 Tax=Streptomyces coelicolor (strain ATCC BAA-471 / A3(2) / M145) TaxID=100226 RepID=Q9FBW0_STRCO|nr:conserved hypothetical protein [Streptomyces lividans TK24]MYU47314.1 hypothetical protein [Streptomyces sp. SID7813]NSL84943.1 hypothetical protein [Streptomyces coelicolor]QFI47517.1 hypothetical protein FQ762_40350 [Streptomyces coelicolor A3(2)]QKN70986.1 hypothetical protein HCU77_39365 [Streptomyces coelicolor]
MRVSHPEQEVAVRTAGETSYEASLGHRMPAVRCAGLGENGLGPAEHAPAGAGDGRSPSETTNVLEGRTGAACTLRRGRGRRLPRRVPAAAAVTASPLT